MSTNTWKYNEPQTGCELAKRGQEECALTAEDRKVVDDILVKVTENVKATRALSASLIGRVNGDTYDEQGGRMGRLEDRVDELSKWRWYMMSSYIALLLSAIGYLIKEWIEKHP